MVIYQEYNDWRQQFALFLTQMAINTIESTESSIIFTFA